MCSITSTKVRQDASRFAIGHWASIGPGSEGKWSLCVKSTSKMVKDFGRAGHLVFKGISALNRGVMRKKKNKDIIHYNGKSFNVKLLYRMIHSANQNCVYGTVTN